MNTASIRGWLVAGAISTFCFVQAARAQIVEFRATINAAQETSASTSAATGSAILLYDVSANTFDLILTLNNFTNTLTASHIHEGAVGVSGPVVTNFGGEAVYTRSGNTLRATFRGVAHGGAKLTLLQNGAYLNFHSATSPAGEIRGQLIAQPKRLVAKIDLAQEQAANPTATIASNAFGAAVMTYDSGTNKLNLRISLYNYTNTLTNSHFHEGAFGVSGPVVTGLGAGTVASYVANGSNYTGTFLNLTYTGDPVKLLTGGAYLNFHSNVYAGGEVRGQVLSADELPATRVANVSTRGFVGAGSQALIGGFAIIGSEPVRVLISAKGPSLANYGVDAPLANPVLTIYDAARRVIASNDDIGTPAAGSDLAAIAIAPTNALESAVLMVLPPGNYTAVVSGSGAGTGIALLEVNDLRGYAAVLSAGGASAPGGDEILSEFRRDLRAAASNPLFAAKGAAKLELCEGALLSKATATAGVATR